MISSSTLPARVGEIVEVSPDCTSDEGAIVVCRALSDNKNYGDLELPNGRLAKVVRGNLIVGVLGARQALHGYMGRVPDKVDVGDTLSLLNMGGVIGVCEAPNKDLGPPISVEVIGQACRGDTLLNIRDFALPACPKLGEDGPPLVLVFGTCMNSGKTYAASEIIRLLSHAGVRIAAGKLSGVAAQRDLLRMSDNGAVAHASFVKCGLPSTVNAEDLAAVSRSVIQELERSHPDVILLELGDGIIGGYNTGSILSDDCIRDRTACRVLCANDLVGAWGGVLFLEDLRHRPSVVSGPVTDNAVGTTYIADELKLPAFNARNDPSGLAAEVARCIGAEVELA